MLEQLGISWQGLLVQVINFALLLTLLWVVFGKRIVGMLDERSRRIRESMEQAERIRQQAAETDQELQRRLEEARREGMAIVSQASEAGERVKEEARQEARREAQLIAERMRAEMQREHDKAIEELRKQFVDVAIAAAEKVIKESLDKQAHQRLIEEVLEESAALKKD